MSDLDARLAEALRPDAPPVRDPIFRVEVLTRLERARFKRRAAVTVALAAVAAVLAGLPRRSSPKASEVWRRRESNPRPRVNPRETLHAYPLLFSRTRREEAAQNRQAPDPVNLAVRRRAAV